MEKKRKYLIFSKVIEVNYNNEIESPILMRELELYKKVRNDVTPDIVISLNRFQNESKIIASNPKPCRILENGFEFEYLSCTTRWTIDNNRIFVNFHLKDRSRNIIKKFYRSYFSHIYELVGMLFHENVLLPTILMFFSAELAVLHGSTIADKDGNAYLLSGTGGTGKTSSSLQFLLKDNLYFLSDDMCVVDKTGKIFSNFAYPKIYFYNTINQKDIEKKVLHTASLLDRFNWKFWTFLNKSVFRRIPPQVLYDNRILFEGKLKRIFILFRCNVSQAVFSTLDKNAFVNLSVEIIKAEWSRLLFNYLISYKFNNESLGKKSIVDMDIIVNNFKLIYASLYDKSEVYLVKIPFESKPEELYSFIRKKIID